MTEKNYSIIFRGDIVPNFVLQDVKSNLKNVFKADDARIESLFTGKPVPLKKYLNHEEAIRYQTVLKKAGAIVSIEQAVKGGSAPSQKKGVDLQEHLPADPEAGVSQNQHWQIAPVGSTLFDSSAERRVVNCHIETDHLSVSPQYGNLVSDEERESVLVAAIDIDVTEWELTPYGELLLSDSERNEVLPLSVDISNISIVEARGNLLKASERPVLKMTEVDISHITLEPNGD